MNLTIPTKIAFATAIGDPSATNEIIVALETGGGSGGSGGSSSVTSVAGRTGDVLLTKTDVGLNLVDNTADISKPISTATQTALNTKPDNSAVVHNTGNETVAGTKTFSTVPVLASLNGILKATSGTPSVATEGTDYLSGVSNKLPVYFPFTGTGTPTIANDVTSWSYVDFATTVFRFTVTCKTAPTGNFQITIKRSADSGTTFPDTIATVTVGSGVKLATTTTIANAVLSAGDVLRCDIISVNGAADWKAKLSTLSRNQ